MRAAVTKHLRENFTLRELKALEAISRGDIHPLDEKGQRRLQEKIEAYAKFAQEVGAKVGAEMGERAESNLKESF